MPTEYREIIHEKFPDRPGAVVDRQIDAVLEFLEVSSEGSGTRFIPLTRAADEVWHEMIVQTVHYARLCATLPSARFVHHVSIGFREYVDKVGRESAVREWLQWVPDHISRYGAFTEETARDWAVVEFLRNELGMSLDDVNRLTDDQKVA